MEDNNKKNVNEELNSIRESILNMQNNLNKDYNEQNGQQEVVENPTVNEEIKVNETPVVNEEIKAEKKEKGKKGNSIVILLILLFVVALFGVWFFAFGGKEMLLGETKKEETKKEIKPEIKKTEYTMSGNSLEDFDLYFLKLENEKVNKVYSPLSIKYVLEMLNEGADGETKEQISSVIGKYEARKYTNSNNMSFANAIFISESLKDAIKEDYTNGLLTKYNADVKYDSFTSPDNINAWVKEKTLNIIPKALDSVDKSTIFMLVNALAIDMEWKNKFLEPITSEVSYAYEEIKENESGIYIDWMVLPELLPLKFENMNESVSSMEIQASFNRYDIISELGEENIRNTVSDALKAYMDENSNETCYEFESCYNKKYKNLTDSEKETIIKDYLDGYIEEIGKNYNRSGYNTDFSLYVDDNVKVFAKDLKEYNGTTLQYVGIMPTNVGLDSYINNLTADELNNILGSLKELKIENFKDGVLTRIQGYIPKFKFNYELKLKEDLKKLGIVNIFESDKSDLSKLTSSKPAYINSTAHKATIEFTQDGIKAAAVSMLGGKGAGVGFDYLFEVPVEIIDLRFNKPYMFLVRDKSTGEVWFTGTVYEPLLYNDDPSIER